MERLNPYQCFPVTGSTGITAYATLDLTKNKKCEYTFHRGDKMDIVELKKYFKYEDEKLYKWSKRYSDWKEYVPTSVNTGYYRVSFGSGKYSMYVHIILWMLYTGKNIPNGMQVDHKNGIRTDNRFENLRLVTCRQNSMILKFIGKGKKLDTLM